MLGDPPPEGQDDGVVAYSSAHLEEAQSEFIVFHSGPLHPGTSRYDSRDEAYPARTPRRALEPFLFDEELGDGAREHRLGANDGIAG